MPDYRGSSKAYSSSRHESRGTDAPGLRELRREVGELRRANSAWKPREAPRPVFSGPRDRSPSRRRLFLLAGAVGIALVLTQSGLFGSPRSYALPSRAALAGLSVPRRIVAIANSQVGYRTTPAGSYCNKFSAYWNAPSQGCPNAEASEEWCADFAAWAWRKAGVEFTYGYGPGELNAAAASFYRWGIAHDTWHSALSGYRPAAGDVAVYGLRLGASPYAAHVAIVTAAPRGQRGPDVINGDGDRTGFSVVETGTDQLRADASHHRGALLAGYVSP